jgi:hypothetical protein
MDLYFNWFSITDSSRSNRRMLAEKEARQKSRLITKTLKIDPIKSGFFTTEIKLAGLHDLRPYFSRIKEVLLAVVQRKHQLLNLIARERERQEDVQ